MLVDVSICTRIERDEYQMERTAGTVGIDNVDSPGASMNHLSRPPARWVLSGSDALPSKAMADGSVSSVVCAARV